MAASEAPTNTTNVYSASSSTTANNIGHNFHELCRSCGKTNAELYDLFQTTNLPFSTSSTTCYTHLNNCSTISSTSSTSTTNKPSTSATFTTAAGCAKSSIALTFDSLAATAKATAKGQSNMDNILQEMQIWQLLIKCNDGLPQRICAKCTAQFYMIHKFRRKCLKVQTQLRALYEEQQKCYERQQEKEKNVTVKDATIEATSTPASPASPVAAVPQPALLAEVVKPPVMHKVNDLVNDNYGETQQAVVDNTNTQSSVSFEANTGNTNDFIAPNTTATITLLDNAETMQQKTEANEPTPTSSAPASPPAPAFIDKTFEARIQEHCTVTVTTGLKLKDEKTPLLKPAVLLCKRSPPLTLQQPLEQICDNDTTTDQTNASKKSCLDQEELLETHIIFKSNSRQTALQQCHKNDGELFEKDARQDKENSSSNASPSPSPSPQPVEANETFKLPEELNLQKDCALSKANSESLFVTKAALKAYTIPPCTSETENRDHQKPITNSEAIELKNANDNNNNDHRNNYAHRYDNRNEELLNDTTCSSTSNSTPSSCSSTARKQQRTNIPRRRKVIKYANHNRRPGHCYKSNAKAAATTNMARTILSYGDDAGMAMKRKQRRQKNKHKLKRLLPKTNTNATLKKCQQKIVKMCHQRSLQQQGDRQMEDEMSSTVSTTTSTSPSSSPSSSPSPSSSAISSTSSLLRATTPAATDLVRNCAGLTSYCKKANENINKTVCSSADRLSSNEFCSMWKTKAAMKENANDMSVEVVALDNDEKPTCNIPEISLPYIAPATPTGSASLLSSSTSIATVTETETETDKSSKTLLANQSSTSTSSSLKCDNNNLMDKYNTNLNNVMSSPDNQVKDIQDVRICLQTTTALKHNLRPEEADQKQINTNNHNRAGNEQNTIAIVEENTQAVMEFITTDGDRKERANPQQDVQKNEHEQQRPTILTPPAKVGGMKLIIQRKRGARFKCRRKDDDEITATHDNHEPTAAKRKRKSKRSANLQNKLEMISFVALDGDYCSKHDEAANANNKDNLNEFANTVAKTRSTTITVPEFNGTEDENKENPIPIVNSSEFDSDSNVSMYRDPLLIRNELLEDDTHLTDFSKTQLSLQTECSKEMYKLYKEKANLESPKKLIVRVPLTSLTQDFKRLHLTMEDQEDENEAENATTYEESPLKANLQETNNVKLCLEPPSEQEYLPLEQESSLPANSSSSQSELLGFSQNTESSSGTVDSSQPSIEMPRYIEPPLCSASSKINDFINDFQNNCIDSSEIEEACDIIPTLAPSITQELSDEIRDVEDTLNGILSEMHDKDMYTPRSGETEEFLSHSVYSPLTDSPTTPSQSFYAESPCTINSNPMSVSPFIPHNMDYNAMTPQSNHSSMGFCSSYMGGGGGSTGPHTSVYSEHCTPYNECFEESTQSELIGFQNDIPCFENIEIANELQGDDANDEEEAVNATDADNCNNSATSSVVNNNVEATAYNDKPEQFIANQPTHIVVDRPPEVPVQPQQIPYRAGNYQPLHNTPTLQMQNSTNAMISNATVTQPAQYIVANTNQGPIFIANSQLKQGKEQIGTSFKPHNNSFHFLTLGRAMPANNQTQRPQLINNNATNINWPTAVNTAPTFNQRPVLSAANGTTTTTYFINANGELYQANIPTQNLQNPAVNTIFVPPTANQTFKRTSLDSSDNYNMHAMQQQQQHQQQQHAAQQQNTRQSSQYIMLVNNLGGSPQYYATTNANLSQTVAPPNNISTPTVLFQPAQAQNLQNNFHKISPKQSNSGAVKSTYVPITPALEAHTNAALDHPTQVHQKVNDELQKQIKQRQLHILQPKLPNVTQKITLVCRFCQKRPKFKNNLEYSNHIINTHPAEKPYNCTHCPMHFTRRSERQLHVAQVHGSRYQCAQCSLSFCAQRTLDFHLQKYHANSGRSQQHVQQSSSSTTAPATYQLLQHNQQQRLVRVEDVHVQVTDENKNKRSIDLTMDDGADGDDCGGGGGAGGAGGGGEVIDINTSQSLNEVEILSHTTGVQQLQQQQQQQLRKSRKLCCPDCNGDDDDCCVSNENFDQNDNNNNSNTAEIEHNSQQYTGNASFNNHPQQHVTIPSPEQTEPDSTTTLRHFRKRQLCEISPHFASVSPSSSTSSSSPPIHNNAGNNIGGNDNINLHYNSPDNILAGEGGGEQVVLERALRGSHNCLLCEESFTNEIALRKHHHLAHGAAAQSTTCSSATTTSLPLICTICKRGFRMRNALQRHMETHDAEGRPFECNICQVRFPRPSQLTLHKLTVHKFEKPNSCEKCGKQFGTESAMKAHAAEHDDAVSGKSASTSEPSTSSSQSQLSSHIYFNTLTANTTSTTNEQNINLQSTTTGEDSSVTAPTSNNVSGLAT